MKSPKIWAECAKIASAPNISIPPQLIAEAYGIKWGTVEVKRAAAPDEGTQLMLNYVEACEKCDLGLASIFLREFFESYTPTKADSEYVFRQAMYLKERELAMEALRKMISQTPD